MRWLLPTSLRQGGDTRVSGLRITVIVRILLVLALALMTWTLVRTPPAAWRTLSDRIVNPDPASLIGGTIWAFLWAGVILTAAVVSACVLEGRRLGKLTLSTRDDMDPRGFPADLRDLRWPEEPRAPGAYVARRTDRLLGLASLCASIMPGLGLAGTAAGLLHALGGADPASGIEGVQAGVRQALGTTLVGLALGLVPSMAAAGWLSDRARRTEQALEDAARRLLRRHNQKGGKHPVCMSETYFPL